MPANCAGMALPLGTRIGPCWLPPNQTLIPTWRGGGVVVAVAVAVAVAIEVLVGVEVFVGVAVRVAVGVGVSGVQVEGGAEEKLATTLAVPPLCFAFKYKSPL